VLLALLVIFGPQLVQRLRYRAVPA